MIPEIDVDAVVQNELRTRGPVDFKPRLDDMVGSTDDSIQWAEKQIGKKLAPPKEGKQTTSDAYDPGEAPSYTLPKDMMEDEDTASTLKSAHLAEWIHKNGGDGDRHHHHDPYHIDEAGVEHRYARPGGGYEGVGFNHYGQDEESGFYGTANPGARCTPSYEHIKGCVAGHNLNTFKGKSLEACKQICDKMESCKGFEYFVKSDAAEVSGTWEEGDCTP